MKVEAMIKISRILCPVDFSEFSRHALEEALTLARHYGAGVVALHAYNMPMTMAAVAGDGGFVPVLPPLTADQAEQEALMEKFLASVLAGDVRLTSEVVQGAAVATILDRALTLPADLIVMGTHGRSGVDRMLMGSVTERVLRKAACPVLTVPIRSTSAPEFHRILCPIDFSRSSKQALKYAVSIAQETRAHLAVLHVIEMLPDADSYQFRLWNVPELRAQVLSDARNELAASIPPETAMTCEIEQRIESGKPYKQILKVAAEMRADLIVIGVHGRGAADLLLFGSTTQHVVRQAACPVLTMRWAAVAQRGEARDASKKPAGVSEPAHA
jgi:nucleotide-binding universal stress UspA family protein